MSAVTRVTWAETAREHSRYSWVIFSEDLKNIVQWEAQSPGEARGASCKYYFQLSSFFDIMRTIWRNHPAVIMTQIAYFWNHDFWIKPASDVEACNFRSAESVLWFQFHSVVVWLILSVGHCFHLPPKHIVQSRSDTCLCKWKQHICIITFVICHWRIFCFKNLKKCAMLSPSKQNSYSRRIVVRVQHWVCYCIIGATFPYLHFCSAPNISA